MTPSPKSPTSFNTSKYTDKVKRNERDTSSTIRILDAGCGNGELIKFMFSSLSDTTPKIKLNYMVLMSQIQIMVYKLMVLSIQQSIIWTNYSSEREVLDMAQRNGLRGSLSYTFESYKLKLRQILKRTYLKEYSYSSSNLNNSFLIKILRYLSSATLVCQKKNIYYNL